MLACKFHFIFYFYLPLKSCNFNYSNLLLLINNSVGIRHCNHQPCSHISGSYLLKLTSYIKAKCLYEVIFFLHSIVYLDLKCAFSPPPISAGGLSLLPNFQKWGFDRTSVFNGGCWKRAR